MRKALLLIITAAIGLAALPACVTVKPYRPTKLKTVHHEHADFEQTIGDVTLRVKKFSHADCYKIFDNRGKKLLTGSHGIQPLQLSIENQSATEWQLTEENMSLDLASPAMVFRRLKKGNALIFWPYIIGEAICFITFPIFWPISLFFLFDLPVGAALTGIRLGETNEQIRQDLVTKSFNGMLTIPSKKSVNTLIFVQKEDSEDTFTVTLTNPITTTEKITFTVALLN